MPGGTEIVATVTTTSAENMGLAEGIEATALIKSHPGDADDGLIFFRNQSRRGEDAGHPVRGGQGEIIFPLLR